MKSNKVLALALRSFSVVGLLFAQSVLARLDVLDNAPHSVELIKTLETRFCFISFVNIDGTKYIIKQKKTGLFRKIVGVVRDAITAHIAESFGETLDLEFDLAHRVDVIPAGVPFIGKPRTDWPATIHTIAPGKMIKEQKKRFPGMNIKQANIGFRRDMLEWMVKHPILIVYVAMDTFLCNHDRHRGNLFYNKKTGSFCAIDMDSSFKFNLCALGCRNFTEMLHDERLHLTKKEINALITYRKYLQFLIDNYKPENTLYMYDYFAEKAGFVEGSELYTEKVALEIASNRQTIMQSYQDVQELVKLIGKLIEKFKKN
jgi:hypothetical protein